MVCTTAVAVVLGTLLTLTQTDLVRAGVAHAQVSSFASGAAQSHVTEPDGTIRGECAYLNAQGESIKIRYKQYTNGQIEAEANRPVQNAVEALDTCRNAAQVASRAAQESIQKTQQEIFRQQQQLHEQIFRHNQALHQAMQFPQFFIPNPPQPFGPQFL